MGQAWQSSLIQSTKVGPRDCLLEAFNDTTSSAASSITLLTDTDHIGFCNFLAPFSMDTTPTSTGGLVINTDSPSFRGSEDAVHRTYIFGGYDSAPALFRFERAQGDPSHPGAFYWEIISKTPSGSQATITYVDDCEFITRAEIIIPVSTRSAAGGADVRACGVSALDALTATLRANQDTECKILIGGYATTGFGTLANSADEHDPTLVLPVADPGSVKPGDLVCEVVTKTLGSAEPSTVTLIASSDCQVVRYIEFVIPVSKETTENSIGVVIAATRKTAALYGANSTTDDVTCLVMGYVA